MRQAGAMRAGSLAAVAVGAGGLLWAFGPGVADLPAGPGLTLQWIRADPERALLTAIALAAWVLLAWLALGLLMCVLTALPGTAGSIADRLSRHVVPAAVRRAAGVAVGASLATAPVLSAGTAMAAPAAPAWQSSAAAWQSAAPSVPAPVSAAPSVPAPVVAAPSVPPLVAAPESGWPDLGRHPSTAPADSASTRPPPPPTPSASPPPAHERPSPGPTLAAPASPSDPSPAQSGIYRVRRGDCLWTIAARYLGPGSGPAAIEAAWHGWYRVNRDVIGADPNLLLPGQRLRPPSG